MKKITFFLALMMITTLAMAQRGNNGYHRGNTGYNSYHGDRGTQYYSGRNYGSSYRGEVRHNRGQVRYDRGYNNGYNQGFRDGARRTRWEYSSCGRWQYRIIERYDCRPGRWVYRNGCRRWIEPTANWTCVSRRRYAAGCSRW